MKIAYIYDVIYPYVKGGAEKRFWELARRLASKGHQVHIYGMKSWEGASLLVKEGVCIHGIARHIPLYKKNGRRSIGQGIFFALHILPALKNEDFDLIDCNAFPYLAFFPVKLFAKLKKIPLVTTWQEVWDVYWYKYFGYLKGSIARFLERQVMRLSDNIIVHSLRIEEELIRCGAGKKNIRLIPDGVDLKALEKIPENHQKFDLFFAGRLIKEKNVRVLIEAADLVKRKIKDVNCLIIGEGPEKERLIELTQRLGLETSVIFKDFLSYEEMVSYMKASKVFVFPSEREGFGIVIIEAMACGSSVVTVKHPLNAGAQLIKDGENGFLCGLGPKEVADRIIILLSNKDLRDSVAKNAKVFVEEFDWDKIADKNEELYDSIVKKSYAPAGEAF